MDIELGPSYSQLSQFVTSQKRENTQ